MNRWSSFKILVLTASLTVFLLSGCAEHEPVKSYYDSVARRTEALVKFERRVIDVYQYELKVTLQTAIDVSNADTASRVLFEEVEYPMNPKGDYFQAGVDLLDYANMINALKNFIAQGSKVDMLMFYWANDNLKMEFQRDTGLTMIDSLQNSYYIPADSVIYFGEFMEFVKFSIEEDTAFTVSPKTAYIDSVIAAQTSILKKRYKYQPLKISRVSFNLSAQDKKNNKTQVDAIFIIYNPNEYRCSFFAQIVLEGKNGGIIHSFSSEKLTIESKKSQTFEIPTVIRSYQAERISRVFVETYDVGTDDERAKKYM